MSFDLAAEVFAKSMTREAWRYLTVERRLTPESIQRWRLGYSPAWPNLAQACNWIGAALDEKLLSVEGTTLMPAPIAANRISIPVVNDQRKTAGLLLRELPRPGILTAKNERYRYFGEPVFGFGTPDDLRAAEIVLVEGAIDVMRCKQAGVEHPVGLMGTSTSFSQESLREWVRGHTRITLFLDWDLSGRLATFQLGKSLRLMAKREHKPLALDVVVPPTDLAAEDPAEIAEDAMLKSVSEQRISFDLFLERCIEESTDPNDRWQPEVIRRILAHEN